ncbi:uncharacterized protein EI97DRAFT_477419 [Westerdykella ornata]|uniref:Actin-like ATPase domain-containing protein n=1 Tax=Westerdykella ornata TaxID=318751 RepID=A0A6A6JW19_WESOR|nr:uncharacterized protein EI97DRAFT_477419 [Westerdykella ornata]KAF2279926.1 hypothetical protein EI97DRAFT_477419 [Westerdykella ornata]
MSEREKPHMIVGVDLGMTCTGVSYANLSIGSETVRWVQKWPGRFQANENKVPTVIVYPNHASEPSSWGFLSETVAESTAEDKDYKEWFKTCLDPAKLAQKQREDPDSAPKSLEEVEKWYEDYLKKMYEYLAFKLGSEISGADWTTARIEFIFSVPTTWPTYPTVENFKRIVRRSGFGSHPQHSVTIGLTEAEAAAVHVSTEAPGIFREGDILLVCDAGGGTTDLSVLRVNNTINQSISLQQLDVVFGETIGSAAIDYAFEKLVQHRLALSHNQLPLPILPEDAAWEMMKSRDFQAVKCEYGSPDGTPIFSIGIPRVPHTYNNPDPEVRIRAGEMTFASEDLQQLFDKQIAKLCKLIDTQLQTLHQKFPGEQVAHLVLSGGLGNSPYVQSRLRTYYAQSAMPNAREVRVRVSPDPQLALYIVQAIAWFVKKGEPVSVDKPIVHNFIKKIAPGDPRKAFPTSVIESHLDAARLPDQMNHETRILCEIQSDLSSADERKFIEKNKRFWNVGKHYLKIEYQVKVLIGPADIRFELWFDNQKLSKDQSIKVDWAPAPPPDFAIYNRAELPESRPAHFANHLAGWKANGEERTHEAGSYLNNPERKRGLGKMQVGLVSLARSSKWSVYG